MASTNNRYTFVSNPAFLGLGALILTLLSLFLSHTYYPLPHLGWIPLFSGLIDLKLISTTTSVLTSLAITGATAALIYSTNNRYTSTGSSSWALLFIYFIALYSTPDTIYFSGGSLAALLYLISIRNTMNSSKGEREIFVSGFLLSMGALVEPRLVVTIPVMFYFSLVGYSFSLRSIILYLTSILLPFVLLFSARYLLFQDHILFMQLFLEELTSISSPSLKVENMATLILLVLVIGLIIKGIIVIIKQINSYKIIKSLSLNRFIITLFLFFAIPLLYPAAKMGSMALIAVPLSFIINEYHCGKGSNNKRRVELLILLIFVILSRVSDFM